MAKARYKIKKSYYSSKLLFICLNIIFALIAGYIISVNTASPVLAQYDNSNWGVCDLKKESNNCFRIDRCERLYGCYRYISYRCLYKTEPQMQNHLLQQFGKPLSYCWGYQEALDAINRICLCDTTPTPTPIPCEPPPGYKYGDVYTIKGHYLLQLGNGSFDHNVTRYQEVICDKDITNLNIYNINLTYLNGRGYNCAPPNEILKTPIAPHELQEFNPDLKFLWTGKDTKYWCNQYDVTDFNGKVTHYNFECDTQDDYCDYSWGHYKWWLYEPDFCEIPPTVPTPPDGVYSYQYPLKIYNWHNDRSISQLNTLICDQDITNMNIRDEGDLIGKGVDCAPATSVTFNPEIQPQSEWLIPDPWQFWNPNNFGSHLRKFKTNAKYFCNQPQTSLGIKNYSCDLIGNFCFLDWQGINQLTFPTPTP